jgi:excisionase family DNA binding protein
MSSVELPKLVAQMSESERAIFDAGLEFGRISISGLLTFEQACRYVDLSPPQFRALVRRGEIPYGAGGASPRAWRFSRAALDAWAAGHLLPNAPATTS